MRHSHIYLAGPWVDREKMPAIATLFEEAGHVITHKWWNYEGTDQNAETEDFLRKCAVDDFIGASTANFVVVYNSAKSEGKAVEQGIAIAKHIPIICINIANSNVSHNVFHRLPIYTHVKTVAEALGVVNGSITKASK